MLSDWPPGTYVVLCVEMAHGCSDLIYSGTHVNVFSLPRLFLLCTCLCLLTLCFPFLFVASFTCSPSLSVCFVGVPSFSVWSLSACGALIPHMGRIRVQGVCVCLYPYAYTHIYALFSLGLDVLPWFTTVWTANPTAFGLTEWHGTKTPQITYGLLTGFNIDLTPWHSVSKHPCRFDIINKSATLFPE